MDDVLFENITDELQRLQAQIDKMNRDFSSNENAFFLCSMALIIFLMQCGFAFLEAGAVRSKNTTNILIKNLLDSCIAIIGYWAIGYAFGFGKTQNSTVDLFIGSSNFFLSGFNDYPKFFFQYVFAATSATIVSGAVAERCEFATYITYCSVISSIVYPILTHWGWASGGWMKQGIKTGDINTTYLDFAGAGVVHLCGGTISFLAAWMMGPRIGRFQKEGEDPSPEIKGHSVPFAALGGFILMFGFLAFNGGSMADIVQPGEGNIVALAMVNTILCGAFAALTYLLWHYFTHGKWTLLLTINACLAGMVSSCAGCNRMEPWGSVFVGIGSGLIYLALSKIMLRYKIDDPLDAFAVHAGGGGWGLISTCIISHDGIAYGIGDAMAGKGNDRIAQTFAQLGWQLVCLSAIVIWSLLWMGPIFWFLKKINRFRVTVEVETKGLDIYKHGEAAYPLHAYGHGWDDFEQIKTHRGKSRTRTASTFAEMNLEQLAEVYSRRTSIQPGVAFGKHRSGSAYHNPSYFEHPEHHTNAKQKRNVPKKFLKKDIEIVETYHEDEPVTVSNHVDDSWM
ncbi:unnamed protein product, partial [Mesorhabditis belari]|uniref:Ammonium transporter n=1 Tax=Mesorhabditis belari TaxID=2138241 RepID=A0AAF3ERH9_9BILA